MNSQQHCTPAKARQVFKFRPYQNLALGAGAFVLPFGLLLPFLNFWFAGGIALVPAFCLYFYLEGRVIFIKCPHCRQDVDTNTPWLCGYKGCRNENVDHQHPFIHECEHCRFIPKAYVCHHCGEPIYLTSDRQKLHLAKSLGAPEPPRASKLDEKAARHSEEILDLKHEVAVNTLKKQAEDIQKQAASPVAKTPRQELEEKIRSVINQGMDREALACQFRAEADAEFAKDRDVHKRNQMYAAIEDAFRELLH